MQAFRGTLAALIVASGLWSTAASAGAPAASASTVPCSTPQTAPYFARWGDQGQYFLAPGASFVPGTSDGWTMSAGASSVAGGDPWDVTGASAPWSAAIPAGGSLTSQAICVNANQNAIRFFYKSPGVPGSGLRVFMETWQGNAVSTNTLMLNGQPAGWQVSYFTYLPSLWNTQGQEQVVISFTPANTPAPWQVDDVMIDPWATN